MPAALAAGPERLVLGARRFANPLMLSGARHRSVAGYGGSYRLGTGSTDERHVPSLIDDGGSATYRAVSCGESHTCALRSDGQAVCFGGNQYRQCGDGTFNDYVQTPTAVTGGITFKRIAAGASHTCGLRASDGRAMCFGA